MINSPALLGICNCGFLFLEVTIVFVLAAIDAFIMTKFLVAVKKLLLMSNIPQI